ncbi:hypothetical protein D9611_008037 [Ephemerocybe angulata]|uniref:Uncharacterized protein n=1 Tax=Ephemerocybe angulata TaxID=980116 RepID=A0A8H5BZC7_9AGAR|nr:hypothetical protein D9611_008037 [Tulosesus angulatus]
MPPRKKAKKGVSAKEEPEIETTTATAAPKATSGAAANGKKALAVLPAELLTKVLAHYKAIGPYTDIYTARENRGRNEPDIGPTLDASYLERSDVLRALSQTCRVYREIFLPILYERMEACITPRSGKVAFYKHIGETLERKCRGLKKNPALAKMVRTVNVSLTRYQTTTILPTFVSCLQSLPNLHTIKVLHAHTQMTTAIKKAFSEVSLPSVRTFIGPGMCHELLKTCTEVRTVVCMEEDGSKFVGVMGKNCKNVEEVRGFRLDGNMAKRLVKAAPNLRVLEVSLGLNNDVLAFLKSFKKLCTIDIGAEWSTLDPDALLVKDTAELCRAVLKASPSTERKYLRLCYRRQKFLEMDVEQKHFIDLGME